MKILELFKEDLENPKVNFFIFDSNGKHDEYSDVDFVQYEWFRSKFNKVKEGDIFIYRRPQKHSENKEFYFFGVCKIDRIIGNDKVRSTFSKKFPFYTQLTQSDLENFEWKFRKKTRGWLYFFNQYGMTQITKEDFINLLNLSECKDEYLIDVEEEIAAIQEIQMDNFMVEDNYSEIKIRSKQKAFSDKVKLNYNYNCAVCGIKTKDFLIGSHIIPWAERKETRLDPSNGICLCSLHDKAFDKGYITIDENYRVKLSDKVQEDEKLLLILKEYENIKIKLPSKNKPKFEYLKYHNYNVFLNRINIIIHKCEVDT